MLTEIWQFFLQLTRCNSKKLSYAHVRHMLAKQNARAASNVHKLGSLETFILLETDTKTFIMKPLN